MWGCASQGLLPSAGRINNYRRALPGALSWLGGMGYIGVAVAGGLFFLSTGCGPVRMGTPGEEVWMLVLWGTKVVCVHVVGGAAEGRLYDRQKGE
jgi:hypothetical protein